MKKNITNLAGAKTAQEKAAIPIPKNNPARLNLFQRLASSFSPVSSLKVVKPTLTVSAAFKAKTEKTKAADNIKGTLKGGLAV